MKRMLAVLLFAALFVSAQPAWSEAYQKYNTTFFGTFDTVVSFTAYTETQEDFDAFAELVEAEMNRLHRVFDAYHAYEGVHNLYALNNSAAQAPTSVEPELFALLQQVGQWRSLYGDLLNPALGAVLGLWHDAREDGSRLPDTRSLQEAASHTDYADVVLDASGQTVFYTDPALTLDLGAVAKGYAAQLVADKLRAAGLTSFLLNAGGNVVCGDAPLDGRPAWTIAIEDIDGIQIRQKIRVSNLAVVTSGDYQRYYVVDGARYHHLIDPDTLFPANYVHAVTILHPDSGLADFLSTTAFLLPYDQSRALIDGIDGAEGFWVLMDGTDAATDGFGALRAK